MDDGAEPAEALHASGVAARLREAREARGLNLAEVAANTRIPLRQLEAIERSDYAALPSPTYVTGFVRSYARAVGLDPVELTRELRAELGREPVARPQPIAYVPGDPARTPSRLFAWTAALVALLILGSYGLWRSGVLDGSNKPPELIAAAPPAPAPGTGQARPATGVAAPVGRDVVLAANSPVWVNIRDGANTLLKKEMAAGERFAVPAAAQDPRIVTGRPEALTVTVGGKAVPPLGPPAKIVRNASLKADALLASPAPGAAPAA